MGSESMTLENPGNLSGSLTDSAGVVQADNTSAEAPEVPHHLAGVTGGLTAGTKGITFPAGHTGGAQVTFPSHTIVPGNYPSGSGGIPFVDTGAGNPHESVVKSRLEDQTQEEIHDFILANRKVIADLEDMVIDLLRGEDLISEEIVHGLLSAKERAYKLIEKSLKVLQDRCKPVVEKEEVEATTSAPGRATMHQILGQLCGKRP